MTDYTDEEILAALGQEPTAIGEPSYTDEEILSAIGEQPKQKTGLMQDIGASTVGAMDTALFGFSDEALAGAMAAIDPSKSYKDYLPEVRAAQQRIKEGSPWAYGGGQLGGAIAPAVAAAPLGATKAIGQYAARGIPQSIGVGLGTGAVSGGVYGLGSGEEGERVRSGTMGAAFGAGGGVAGGAIGGLASRALKAFPRKQVAQKVGGALQDIVQPTQAPQDVIETLAQKQAPEVIENVPKAYGKVSSALKKDFGADLDTALEAYKKGDMSLAELYGKRTESLAEAAALYPAGREVAERYLTGKTDDAYTRIMNSARQNISGIDNFYTNADDLLNAGRAKASPYYAKAYEQSVENTDIFKLPEIQSAVEKAYKQYPSELSGAEPNSIKVLDYAKRILDDQIDTAKRAGQNNFARSRTDIKNQLLIAMDDVSPDYKKARSIAGDYLSVDDAMNKGLKAFNGDSEAVKYALKGMAEQEKNAYKIGFGKAIRKQIGSVNEGANPYKRILGSPEKRKVVESILSPREFINFEKSLKAEDRLFKLRNKVLSGSPTAYREEAKNLIEGGAVDAITGVPKQTFTNALSQMKVKLLDGLNEKTAAKVSDILYETDPIKKLEIIDMMGKAKDFTQKEQELVKRAYAIAAPRYDVLSAKEIGRRAGGLEAAAISQPETKITVTKGNQ